MDFLKPARYFFAVSAALTVISLVLLFYPGPKLSIEFTGGTRMEVAAPGSTAEQMQEALKTFGENGMAATINRTQQGNYLLRMRNLDDETHQALLKHLKTSLQKADEVQYTTIGPTVGTTLKRRALTAVFVASIGIVLYLAWAFRKIPRRFSPWKFGITAVATLLHDVMVTVGIFTILSYFTNFEADTLFITALLTILGYSVNDTIIIFDRIRDNLFQQERKEEFAVIANRAVGQSWRRSCWTSLSTLIMLFALALFGAESIRWFVLTLIVGITLGTYSSIFVATPILVYWNRK